MLEEIQRIKSQMRQDYADMMRDMTSEHNYVRQRFTEIGESFDRQEAILRDHVERIDQNLDILFGLFSKVDERLTALEEWRRSQAS